MRSNQKVNNEDFLFYTSKVCILTSISIIKIASSLVVKSKEKTGPRATGHTRNCRLCILLRITTRKDWHSATGKFYKQIIHQNTNCFFGKMLRESRINDGLCNGRRRLKNRHRRSVLMNSTQHSLTDNGKGTIS